MKAVVLQEEFLKALTIASRFTMPKVQLPILANVLLETKGNALLISATNLEISVSIQIGAEITEEGNFTLPAKTIVDIISNVNKGKINLSTDGEKITISNSKFSSNLVGMPAHDFPQVPKELEKEVLELSSTSLFDILSKVLFSVSVDESRPILTGVLCIFTNTALSFVSTDGFRLSQKKLAVTDTKDIKQKMIVPKNILTELTRLKDESETIEYSYSETEKQLVCKIGSIVVSSRLIEGEFPDFEKIIPKEINFRITVGKDDLLRAVKLASVFARDSANLITLTLEKEKSLRIQAESSQKGGGEAEIDVEVELPKELSKPLSFAFNCKFLEDYLSQVKGEDVSFEGKDSLAPVLFKDLNDPDFLHIIMPIRVQK